MKLIEPIEISSSMLISSTIAEDDAPAYNAGTAYAIGDLVILTSTHRIYRSVTGANTGNNPATNDGTNWLDSGATMRWRMLDKVISAESAALVPITVSLQLTTEQVVTAIALLNVTAAAARIVVTDPLLGVVYDQSVPLISDSGILDWYAYFNTPIRRTADCIVENIPAYVGARIDLYLTGSGLIAIGEVVLGSVIDLATTLLGAKVGIRDYSVKSTDDFGAITVTPRSYSKRGTFNLYLPSSKVDEVHQLLSGFRATPIVYWGVDNFSSTIICGFFKTFDIDIAYRDVSYCSIEIEGLT